MPTFHTDSADAEPATKAEIRRLEQRVQTGFTNATQEITTSISIAGVAQAKSNQRLAGIVLGAIAIATTITIAVLA